MIWLKIEQNKGFQSRGPFQTSKKLKQTFIILMSKNLLATFEQTKKS